MKSIFTMLSGKVASLLLKIGAMTFRFNPPYTYTTGLKSPIYLDNRLVMSYPKIREKIINYYIDVIKKNIGLRNVEWISATATTAIPHGAWVAHKLRLPLVFVRPTTKMAGVGKKTYGKGNKMEGYLRKGAKVVIIEDHISTGTSAIDNARAIRENGGKVNYCIASTTYETTLAKKNFKEDKIKLITLTTGKIIVETAFKEKKLTKKQKEIVDLWLQNPPIWARKMGIE